LDPLVGLWAVPPAQGGTNEGVEAHMRRWCATLAADATACKPPGGGGKEPRGAAAASTGVVAAAQPPA
jgi:hypothetical protein